MSVQPGEPSANGYLGIVCVRDRVPDFTVAFAPGWDVSVGSFRESASFGVNGPDGVCERRFPKCPWVTWEIGAKPAAGVGTNPVFTGICPFTDTGFSDSLMTTNGTKGLLLNRLKTVKCWLTTMMVEHRTISTARLPVGDYRQSQRYISSKIQCILNRNSVESKD